MKKTLVAKLLTATMAAATTIALPLSASAQSLTYPAGGSYMVNFKGNDITEDQMQDLENTLSSETKYTPNADGSTTVEVPDRIGDVEISISVLNDAQVAALNNHTFDWADYVRGGTGLPKSTASASDSSSSASTVCNHNFVWKPEQPATETTDAVEALVCENCGQIADYKSIENTAYAAFLSDAADEIADAKENGTVTLDTTLWLSLNRSVVDALAARPDVTLKITYTQKGERKALEIPAGSDLSSLVDENGYIGFSRLAAQYAVPYVYGAAQ